MKTKPKGVSFVNRIHYLAAEVYGYSYDNYQEKVEMGHVRFTKYMPQAIKILEKAEIEPISNSELAKKLEIEVDKIDEWKEAYKRAKEIVDAGSAGASFKTGVRETVKNYVEEDKINKESIDALVEQILYRTADFGNLLKRENKELYEYSEMLRFGDDNLDG